MRKRDAGEMGAGPVIFFLLVIAAAVFLSTWAKSRDPQDVRKPMPTPTVTAQAHRK